MLASTMENSKFITQFKTDLRLNLLKDAGKSRNIVLNILQKGNTSPLRPAKMATTLFKVISPWREIDGEMKI